MKKIRLRYGSALFGVLFCLASMSASAIPVELELQLVIDVSGSVSTAEFELQRDGYEDAFNDPVVQAAIESFAADGGIAVSVSLFGSNTSTSIGWTQLLTATDAGDFASALGMLTRTESGGTNIAGGIELARESILNNNYEGDRLVIDVSGDGIQNRDINGGFGCSAATTCIDVLTDQRDLTEMAGITINGLAITNDVPTLADYFTQFVITSDGFVETATFDTFSDAVIAKIGREIAPPPPNDVPEPAPLALLGLGLMGMGWLRFRKIKA